MLVGNPAFELFGMYDVKLITDSCPTSQPPTPPPAVATVARADSVSSLSSHDSYQLPKATSRKHTTRTYERVEHLEDEVNDAEIDLIVTTVAGTSAGSYFFCVCVCVTTLVIL